MNPLKTFPRGGVHPEENKLSAHQPIQDFPMPKQIIVPLGQCLGAPADCIVKLRLGQRPLARHWHRRQSRCRDGPHGLL